MKAYQENKPIVLCPIFKRKTDIGWKIVDIRQALSWVGMKGLEGTRTQQWYTMDITY